MILGNSINGKHKQVSQYICNEYIFYENLYFNFDCKCYAHYAGIAVSVSHNPVPGSSSYLHSLDQSLLSDTLDLTHQVKKCSVSSTCCVK